MRRFRSVDAHAGWLLTALGIAATACGGSSSSDGGLGGQAGSGTGGVTGGTGGTGGVTGGTGGGTANKFPCQNPQPIVVDGQDTGVDSCDGGMVRRREAKTCPTAMPRVSPCAATQMNCSEDTDCNAQANGYCTFNQGGGGAPSSCNCAYGCVNDSECAEGYVCLCGNPVGKCVPADCSTSDDCEAGFDCLGSPGGSCSSGALTCQTPADECGSQADCGGFQYCGVGAQGNLVCKTDGCAGLGRPFLVDGAARLASVAARDFGGGARPRLDGVSETERLELCDHWTQVGLMEHASIAAFARFGMQLLGLGAPLELIERSNAAQVDETRHARVAFAFASAYAGHQVGPGALDLVGALPPLEPRQVLSDVIREGCIGETLAAIEAEHAAEHATDPEVRAALAAIARDEGAHAELAWHFVAWLLRVRPELADFARQQLSSACDELRAAPLAARDPGDARRLALGIVAGLERDELRRDAIERVVVPCAAALLDAPRQAADHAPEVQSQLSTSLPAV